MPDDVPSSTLAALREVDLTLNGIRVLSNVNLEVYPDEIVGLVGANGAGKSSVANVLCGYYKPTSGRVFLGGEDVSSLASARFANMGVRRSFQSVSYLRGLSIHELVMLGAEATWPAALGNSYFHTRKNRNVERIVSAEARELLAKVELGAFADRTIEDCPYGVRKLADVARAFMTHSSRIIILDEPTSGVSEAERKNLVEMIGTLQHSRSVGSLLVVDHDVGFIRSLCKRVIVLEEGSVLADGPCEKVFADRRVIASFVGTLKTNSAS